jgi:hypothetical protein
MSWSLFFMLTDLPEHDKIHTPSMRISPPGSEAYYLRYGIRCDAKGVGLPFFVDQLGGGVRIEKIADWPEAINLS